MNSKCEIVLVGGGHSHAIVLESWMRAPLEDVHLTLISRDLHAPYSGMIPGLIAGHYDFEASHIALKALAERAGVKWVHDHVCGVDLKARQVLREGGEVIPFDLLSINTGSTPPLKEVPGAVSHVVPIKPMDQFLHALQLQWARMKQAAAPSLRLVVVGGGAGGVEVMLALEHRLRNDVELRKRAVVPLQFTLVSGGGILSEHPRRVQQIFAGVLQERGIQTHEGRRVIQVSRDGVLLDSGMHLPADMVVWITGASPAPWIANSGLAVDERGFLRVNDFLQSVSHPFVFGAGDVAGVEGQPRPKAGVFAVREGKPLFENLVRTAQGRALKPVRLQKRFLTLITTGGRHAVGSRNGLTVQGRWVWKWKDRIDRAFMRRFEAKNSR